MLGTLFSSMLVGVCKMEPGRMGLHVTTGMAAGGT
jgi:hypothetical protein